MKTILIDPFERKVAALELIGEGLDPIYAAIHADCFSIVALDDKGDALFIDDDGLFRERQEFFAIGNYPHPLAGRSVLLGTDDEGNTTPPRAGLEQVQRAVRWLSGAEAVTMHAAAVAAMHAHAATENAKDGMFHHIVQAPTLELDPETGKARAR